MTAETTDDLGAAVQVASRMADDARLLHRYVREYAQVIAPDDAAVVALATLTLQCGATAQAIQRIAQARQRSVITTTN